MKRLLLIFLLVIFTAAACSMQAATFKKSRKKLHKNMEKITFVTQDGVTISGIYEKALDAEKAVLMLHMMPAAKESFQPLQDAFAKISVASLAIDLRGHGESLNSAKGKLNYQKFQDSDHQASRYDVDSAVKWLEAKGFSKANISLVGASIGANLSIEALSRDKSLKKAVLLSPGLNYRGVSTDSAAKKLDASQKVLLVAAEGDVYSADSIKALNKILGAGKSELIMYKGVEHGTNMWKTEPGLMEEIVRFLK